MAKKKDENELLITGKVEVPDGATRNTPDPEADFSALLRDYAVEEKAAAVITKHIADTGSDKVFEMPMELLEKLAKFPRQIPPMTRKNILDHWIAQNKIVVPDDYEETAEKSPEELRRGRRRKTIEGETWVVKQDEKGMPRLVWAREGEEGVSLEEAKRAVTELRKEYVAEEPLIIFDSAAGKHIPNFKSEIVKANPLIGWAAARQMDKAAAEGVELDPLDLFIEQEAKHAQFKEVLGGTKPPESKGTVAEIVSALKDLQEMAKTGQTKMPDWFSDPVKFMEIVKTLNPKDEGGGASSWTSDPVKFMEVIEKFTAAGKPDGDDALKTEVAELRKTIEANERQRNLDLITAQQNQIKTLTDKVEDLVDSVTELKRPVTGRTEMDLMHEGITEIASVLKSELPGTRSDLKEIFRSSGPRAPKTLEEREEQKARHHKTAEADEELEELGKRMGFA